MTFNYAENLWHTGTLSRSTWADRGVYPNPYATEFDSGDTVSVSVLVREGNKERIQKYEGVVISKKGGKGLDASFTVRKVTNGVGVERIFPLHSPTISSINVKQLLLSTFWAGS